MPSHIGFESATGKDNWTLTRSIPAENSPYYETGLRIGYTTQNDKWYMAVLYLNGWQRIQRINASSTPASGFQLTYRPSPQITFNYSNFAGSDQPDSTRQMRYFQDLYGILELTDHWGITAGFDYGIEQKQKGSNQYDQWYAPVLIVRCLLSEKIVIAGRAEYYHDPNNVMIDTKRPYGFKTFGFSANIDYHIWDHALWRMEVRNFVSEDPVFLDKTGCPSGNEAFISSVLAISF